MSHASSQDGDDGVGVVELEDDPLRQPVQVEVARQHRGEEVRDRAGDEEVLLLEPQLLALRRRVLRVQHLGDVLREGLRARRGDVVALVEDLEVERLGRLGAPQPQRVDAAVAVPGDHVVVRDALDVPRRVPARALPALLVGVLLGAPAEPDGHRLLRVGELPRRAERQPVVRLLHLPAVDEGLPEDAVLVPDAVPDRRDVHRRERVDEARGQPAEAAVAEAGLDLLRPQLVQVDAEVRHRLLGDLRQVGGEQRVAELAAEQVLGGQVPDGLRLRLALPGERLDPPRHQVVPHGAGQGEVAVVDGRALQGDALAEVELPEELPRERRDGVVGGDDAGRGGGLSLGHAATVTGAR
jgi:hypothetical protein